MREALRAHPCTDVASTLTKGSTMKRFHLSFPALFALGLFACGPVEIRISKAEGE